MSKVMFWVAIVIVVWGATYMAKAFAAQSNVPSLKSFFGAI